MESCLNIEPERQQFNVEDVKRDLSSEFSIAPSSCGTEDEGHLQVYLRVRPFTSAEGTNGESQDCVSIEPPDTVLLKPPRLSLPTSTDRALPQTGQRFQFSQVYGPDTTQRELFEGTVKDLVKDVLRGKNSLVFTYGVTNAGKTFTFLGPNDDVGVLPRTLALIFSSINQQIFPGTSIKPHRCREFTKLSQEQQDKEALFKRNLLRQLKESDKSTSSYLKCSDGSNSEGSSLLGWSTFSEEDSVVELEADSRFSVWVSFCEIYNENIHDLLEAAPCGAVRRAALRLSQDVKGNSFVKDLHWVQVNNAEEAHRVLRLGKRNQSFSSTRLNHLSSRSHSIFSIRVLRIEDIGTPRVQTVSELCLCDLAGSERCGKTQNNGERLKEAGNINTSLLILGKCINALRHNQKAKLLQHVPFRESKLTHYLQGFFRGHGKACMIVNINQCASMYDETLNVLKFSAVAQKVVVLSSRPPPIIAQKDSSELSILINSANWEGRGHSRRSSLIGWESSLEDVLEDEDYEDEEEEMEQTVLEETLNLSDDDEKIVISRKKLQRQGALLEQLKTEGAQALLMEARVREEISREFSDLFSKMQSDYNERLARETEILEERAEHRMKIFQELVQKMSSRDGSQDQKAMEDTAGSSWTSAEEESVCGRSKASFIAHAAQDKLSGEEVGRVEDEDRLRLVSALEEKSSDMLRLQKRMSELQKRLDQESESSQEAAAALEKERRGKEATMAALGKEKEENQRRQQEQLLLRQQFTQVTNKLEAAEQQVEMEAQRAQQAMTRLQAAEKRQEEQSEQVNTLSLEVERLKQKLQASSISSACEGDQLREQAAELRKALDQERQKLQDFNQQLQQLRRTAQEREESSQQHLEQLRAKLQQATEEAAELQEQVQQLHHRLREQGDGAKDPDSSSSSLAKDLRRMNSDLQAEVSSLRVKVSLFEESSRTLDLPPSAVMQKKLAEMETSSVQREAQLQEKDKQVEFLQKKLQEKEQQVESLQEKEQQVESLQEKLQEKEQHVESLQKKLQEKDKQVESLQEKEQQVESLQEKEQQVVSLHEKELQVESLQEKLQEKEQQVESLQEKLQEKEQQVESLHVKEQQVALLQEHLEKEESHTVQEARRREVERRRELLAAAHEALALKEEALQKNVQEINRLKENLAQDSEKARSLNVELQRREEESSDLREKLADYKKQVQQVHKEVSVMKEEEKTLRQKLGDVEKSRKQLQCDLGLRDRTIQQLRTELSSNTKREQKDQLYQKAREDLQAKEQVMEDMRLALTEQELTQEQMEEALEEKLSLVQELSTELEKLKAMLSHQDLENQHTPTKREEAAQAQDSLKTQADRHQGERRRWQEDKMSLIGQAKAAEERRNQEMRKFVEDRERYSRQQNQLESQLAEKQQTMDAWKKDRDTLVAALEVQLKKLLCSQAEKDKAIQELSRSHPETPAEAAAADPSAAELQAALSERDAEIQRLKDQLEASRISQVKSPAAAESTASGRSDARASISSQTSSGCPTVLESSEISTENGRTRRFPQPELEISFSPLQPNRMALRRQGQRDAVTVKITRSGRKRKSGEMEKDDMEAENRKNKSKLNTHQEEFEAHSTKKEGTLQKIGDFLQSSPTLLGSKAKKMMSLVSGRGDADAAASSSSSSSSRSLRVKKSKRKLYNPEISSPMEIPPHPMVSREPKESDHQVMKRRLRCRTAK